MSEIDRSKFFVEIEFEEGEPFFSFDWTLDAAVETIQRWTAQGMHLVSFIVRPQQEITSYTSKSEDVAAALKHLLSNRAQCGDMSIREVAYMFKVSPVRIMELARNQGIIVPRPLTSTPE